MRDKHVNITQNYNKYYFKNYIFAFLQIKICWIQKTQSKF